MRATQQLVRLADLNDGEFVQAKRESRAAFRARILNQEWINSLCDKSKVTRYVAAMKCGNTFPPIFAFELEGKLYVDDGWNRCAAAALCGRAAVRAVVIKVASWDEADNVSTELFELEYKGITSWRARLEAVSNLVAA